MKFHALALTLGAIATLPGAAVADSIAELTVDSGSTASVQLRVEIGTFLGGDSDTDSTTVSVTGFASADLVGDEPFNVIDINDAGREEQDPCFLPRPRGCVGCVACRTRSVPSLVRGG